MREVWQDEVCTSSYSELAGKQRTQLPGGWDLQPLNIGQFGSYHIEFLIGLFVYLSTHKSVVIYKVPYLYISATVFRIVLISHKCGMCFSKNVLFIDR